MCACPEGRIAADTSLSRKSGRKVEAVVTGIPIRKFVVNGGEHLDLGEVKQPDLDLHINGNGTVTGSGEVDHLRLTVAGPGKAALGGLSVTDDAKVAILGNGVVALAPLGDVRLFIAGNGKLAMASKPRSISQTIIGHGEIEQITAAAAAGGHGSGARRDPGSPEEYPCHGGSGHRSGARRDTGSTAEYPRAAGTTGTACQFS